MRKETAKGIAIALAMAFMFCMGSRMLQPVPYLVQSVIGVLMIIFSVIASGKFRKQRNE